MTSVMAPLTIPIEEYVVIPIVDGIADTSSLHLPAESHQFAGQIATVQFTSRIENGFPPASWPPACGTFAAGSIYVRGGPLANKPICPTCSSVREREPQSVQGCPQPAAISAAPTGEQPSRSLTLVVLTEKEDGMSVCKIEGCTNDAPSRGRFPRVCVAHRPSRTPPQEDSRAA